MSAFQQAKPLSRVTAHLIAAFQGFSGAVNEEQISRISSVQIDAYGGAELAASTTTFDRKVLSAVCPPYAEAGKSGKRVRRKSMATVSNSSGPQPPHVTLVPATIGEQEPESLEDLEMPLPTPQTFFLGGLFMLSAFVVMYLASSIILPIVMAFVLKLLLQPVVRLFERLYVPRTVGALVE